jgi:hypothetical protein
LHHHGSISDEECDDGLPNGSNVAPDLVLGTNDGKHQRIKKNFKDTGLYTIVIPSTSLYPTPLKQGVLELSWVNVLFQHHFSCCQVHIEMHLGPS